MKEHVQDAIAKVQAIAENWSAEEVLRWAFDRFGNNVAISSAFGVEGMAVIDIASRVNPGFRLFSIDTDFLFPETYNLIDEIEARYQVKIEKVYSLLSPEEQEQQYGSALSRRTGAAVRFGSLGAQSRHVLQPAEGRAAQTKAWRTASLDFRHSPGPDTEPRFRSQDRVGFQVWPGENQSNRGLGFEEGVALHP